MDKVKIAAEGIKKSMEAHAEQKKEMVLAPRARSCMLKTKHGQNIECKFWIHTSDFFQYYDKGYTVEDIGGGQYIIKGDTIIVPNHEIRYVIIRDAQSAIPEDIFLSLGGKKKLIQVVKDDGILKR